MEPAEGFASPRVPEAARFTRKPLPRRLIKARSAVRRRLLRDEVGAALPTLLMAGAGRSGTTWLAQVVAAGLKARLVFEPFLPSKVAGFAEFEHLTYRRAGTRDPALWEFCRNVFTGAERGTWLDRRPGTIRPRARVVKAVRAGFLVGWLSREFPDIRMVWVMRDPWSVLRSRHALGWDPRLDLDSLLAQPELLTRLGSAAHHLESSHGKHPLVGQAIEWAACNHVAFHDLAGTGAIGLWYPAFANDPEAEFEALFARIGLPWRRRALRRVRLPSFTTPRDRRSPFMSDRASFAREFGTEVADEVAAVVTDFGLAWTLDTTDLRMARERAARFECGTARTRGPCGEERSGCAE